MILNTESLVLLKKIPKNNDLKRIYDPIINTFFLPYNDPLSEANIANQIDVYYDKPKKKNMISALVGEIF